MIIKINETRKHEVRNETINGLNISCLLESSAVNTVVPPTGYMNSTGFNPDQINVEVSLLRTNKDGSRNMHTLINANLGVIGQYQTILKGGANWRKGLVLQRRGANATQIVTRGLFVYFGGHINVKGDDVLTVTVTVNRGTFGADVSGANSTIQVETNQSIGVEYAIHRFHHYAIQASQNQDTISLGDNITRIALLSFATDPTKPVFRSATLSSDRLDYNANEQELIIRHFDQFPYNVADYLIESLAENAYPMAYPHTRLIHNSEEIDQAKVQFTMSSPNVLQSENFVAYSSFITSAEILAKAMDLRAKHENADSDKIKLTV